MTKVLEVAYMPTNAVFLALMAILAAIDLVTYYFVSKGKHHRNFKGEIVGLGILGTFFGIFAGLQHFDPSVLRTDLTPIVKLLEGLKIAFLTSIAGMAIALALTVLQSLIPSKEAWRVDKPLETLLKDILGHLQALRVEMREESKLTRDSMEESFSAMNEALGQALKKLSEGASKEIIAALEQVIRDFNKNLTEQFGENFKELNAACLKLLEWQDKYKGFVEQTGEFLAKTFASIERTELSLGKISERNAEFVEVSARLGQMLTVADSQLTRLSEHLTREAALYTNADMALAAAQTSFDRVSREMSDGFKRFESGHKEMVTELTHQMKGHYTSIADTLSASSQEIQNFSTKIQGSLTAQSATLSELTSKTSEITVKARSEMEEALRQMENALISVTQQFGDKYRQFIAQVERLTNQ
jgi:DNA anti-recombination protein RmuC